jgi:hypothetical protein
VKKKRAKKRERHRERDAGGLNPVFSDEKEERRKKDTQNKNTQKTNTTCKTIASEENS